MRAKAPITGCVHIVARPGGAEEMLELLTRMAAEAAKDEGTEVWAIHRLGGGTESSSMSSSAMTRPSPSINATRRSTSSASSLPRRLSASFPWPGGSWVACTRWPDPGGVDHVAGVDQ